MKAAVQKWMLKMYGKRCKRYAAACPSCRAWSCFDYLFITCNETMWIKHLEERKAKSERKVKL